MEAGQRNELELVSHGCEFGLEAGDGGVVQFLLPVGRRGTVIGEHLVRKFRMDGVGKLASFLEIRMRSFTPDQLYVWRVGKSAGDGGFDAATDSVEALWSSLSGQEFAVSRIHITSEQVGAIGVGSCHDQRGNAQHVGRKTRGN